MTFTNKSNKQLIHELQDDINNINSSSASEISDINGLQAELDSKQQKTGKLQIYDTVFGVNVISTDELTLGSQSGRINLTAHNIYYDIDQAGNYKNLQNEIDSKQQLITSTSELTLKKITTENLEVDDNLTVEGDVLLNKSFKIYHAAQAKNVIDYTYDAANNPNMTVDMRTIFQDWITTYGKIYAKKNIELQGADFLIQTSVGANVGRISYSAGVEINTIKSYDTGTLQIDDEVEYKTGNGTYQNLKTKITEIEGDISTLQTQINNNSPTYSAVYFDSTDLTRSYITTDIMQGLEINGGNLGILNLKGNTTVQGNFDVSTIFSITESTGEISFMRNGSLQNLNTILDNINTGGGSSYTFNSPLNENNGIVTVDLSSKQDVLNSGSNISINSLLVGNIISNVNSGDIKTSGSIHTHNIFSTGSIVQNTSDNLHNMGLYYSSDGVSQDTNLNIIYPSYFINSGVYDDLNILNMMAFNNDSNSASRSVEIVTPLTVLGNINNAPDTDATATFGRCKIGYGPFSDAMTIAHYDRFNSNDYALTQLASGKTFIGTAANQGIQFNMGGAAKAEITSSGDFFVNQSLRVGGHVSPSNTYLNWAQGPGQSWHTWRFNWPGNNPPWSRVYFQNLSGDNRCHIYATGFQNPSDDRIKDNEEPIINALDTINKIKPMNYQKYGNLEKTDESILESGVIVQQIYYEVPELKHLITYGEESDDKKIQDLPAEKQFDDLTDEDYEGLGWPAKTCSINYIQFIPWLIKGMQEQQTQINEILSKHNDTTITTFTRDNYLFKFIMPIGKIKIKKAIFEHTDITGAYKLKKLDGSLIGIFDGLKVIESHEFDSNGIVKFMLYDMNNNILPCESGSTDVLIIV
jgi:hypothetical protein